MRAASSCTVCRFRKKKCIILRPEGPCTFCLSRELACSLVQRTTARHIQPQQSSSSTVAAALRPQDTSSLAQPFVDDASDCYVHPARRILGETLCEELVDLYFDLIDNKQLSIFHRSSFVADHRAGLIPEYLVLGMIALVARFSDNEYFKFIKPWDRGQPWLRRAMRSFNDRTDLICIPALQACILLNFAAACEGDCVLETLLSAQAIRMVLWLRLPEQFSPDPLQREVEIRVYWQAWMMDLCHSSRVKLPTQMSTRTIAEKPLEEITYRNLRRSIPIRELDHQGRDMQHLREGSILSWMLPLLDIHNHIMMLNEDIIDVPLTQFDIRTKVELLSIRLDQWLSDLPLHLRNTPENQKYFANNGLIASFAVPHLLYHHNGELLYYQFLNKGSTSAQQPSHIDPKAVGYASRCKSHATALSELMWAVNSTHEHPCLWSPVNGHLLVVASSINLHSLLYDTDESRVRHVKQMLEHNFLMLLQFRKYWPTLEFSMSRLRAFHRACQANSAQENFDMDRWMLEFLQRYHRPIGDRSGVGELASEVDFPNSPFTDSTSEVDFWQELFDSSTSTQ